MSMRGLQLTLASIVVASTALLVSACGSSSHASSQPKGTELIGTFKLTAGRCTGVAPTGTYFRMIDPGGTIERGKYFGNPDSTCSDKSFTVQAPGADTGLITGSFQPAPAAAFDATGNALVDRITRPGNFTAIKFGISTNSTDPQTRRRVAAPSIIDTGGRLSGQVTAWSAAWNNLYFNQGSPKPDGSLPGLTSPVTGTYDANTHAFVLTWASQVVGGPFNGFTGYWHLAGTFVAKA